MVDCMIPFAAIPIRFYVYAGIAVLIGLLFWHDHHVTKKLNATRAELSTAKATIVAERENVRKANEASERYAISLENLKAARAATPTRSVRLCVSTPGVPATGAATGTDAAGPEGLPQTAGPDIGSRLYDLSDEADQCAVQRDALIDWIRNR